MCNESEAMVVIRYVNTSQIIKQKNMPCTKGSRYSKIYKFRVLLSSEDSMNTI
jgi:hypothetical protein